MLHSFVAREAGQSVQTYFSLPLAPPTGNKEKYDWPAKLDERCGVILCFVQHAGLLPQYWMLLSQACSAMADFSVSPRLVAALCSFMRVSRALFVFARYLVHNPRPLLQRVLVLDFCQLSAEGRCRSEYCSDVISSAYSSHIFT